MASSMSRSKAADKLLKGMPKDEEETQDLPDGEATANAGGMPEAPPAAQDDAAAAGPESPLMGGDNPQEEAAEQPGSGSMDIDSALATVEASIDGLPEDATREIRTHLEAIKDIVASVDGKAPSSVGPDMNTPTSEPTPDTMPPAPGLGMDERG